MKVLEYVSKDEKVEDMMYEIKFLDSMAFMADSFSNLTSYLKKIIK
jgi:hypothetical protein